MLLAAGTAGKEQHMAFQHRGKQEALVQAFERHLRRSRGAAGETCRSYLRSVREFLTARFGRGRVDVGKIGPSDHASS